MLLLMVSEQCSVSDVINTNPYRLPLELKSFDRVSFIYSNAIMLNDLVCIDDSIVASGIFENFLIIDNTIYYPYGDADIFLLNYNKNCSILQNGRILGSRNDDAMLGINPIGDNNIIINASLRPLRNAVFSETHSFGQIISCNQPAFKD